MKDKSMIDMAGTSMGSGVKMCGSQVGKHMKMGGPKMMGGDEKKGFRESFAENKKAGKKEFEYEGKMYNTQTAEENAKGLSDKDLYKEFEKAEAIVNSFENVPGSSKLKSREEQFNSYFNESKKRENAKIEKAFLGGFKIGGGGPKMMGGDERVKPMQKIPSAHQARINANYEAADKIAGKMKQKMDGTGHPDIDLNQSTYYVKAFYNKAKSLEKQGPFYKMSKSLPSGKYAQPKKAPLPNGPLPKTLTKKDYRKSKK